MVGRFLHLMDDTVDSTTAIVVCNQRPLSIVHSPWNRNRYPETTLFSRAIHDRENSLLFAGKG